MAAASFDWHGGFRLGSPSMPAKAPSTTPPPPPFHKNQTSKQTMSYTNNINMYTHIYRSFLLHGFPPFTNTSISVHYACGGCLGLTKLSLCSVPVHGFLALLRARQQAANVLFRVRQLGCLIAASQRPRGLSNRRVLCSSRIVLGRLVKNSWD